MTSWPAAARPVELNAAAAHALGSGTVFFLGDSVSLQHFRALSCELGIDREVPVTALGPSFRHFRLNATCAIRRDASMPGGTCHITAGMGVSDVPTAEACSTLASSGVLTPADIVVANEGLWHRALSSASAERTELARVSMFASNDSCVHSLRKASVPLLWRETSAQHFARSPTGQYNALCKAAKTRSACGGCGPIQNSSSLEVLNAAVSARMRELGVAVLPFFAPTVPRWNAHLAHRRSSVSEALQPLDCTHWCEPSTVFAPLTPLMLRARARMAPSAAR